MGRSDELNIMSGNVRDTPAVVTAIQETLNGRLSSMMACHDALTKP